MHQIRASKQLKFALILILSGAGLHSTLALDSELSYESFFDVNFGALDEELEVARKQNKKGILLFFEMNGCPSCRFMKEHVLNQRNVQDFFGEHFLRFSVDVEGDVEIVDFQGAEMPHKLLAVKSRVFGTPTFIFYTLEGQQATRYTGETSGADEFLLLGKYVVDEIYKEMSFDKYKRAQLITIP